MGITFQPYNRQITGSDVYNYYTGIGYSPAGAAAMAGRAQVESNFNTGATSPSGTYTGLFQWSPQRYNAGVAAGYDMTSPEGQMAFANSEIQANPSWSGNIVNATDTGTAEQYVTNNFEIAPGQMTDVAANNAQNILAANGSSDNGFTVTNSATPFVSDMQFGTGNVDSTGTSATGATDPFLQQLQQNGAGVDTGLPSSSGGSTVTGNSAASSLPGFGNLLGSTADYFVRAVFVIVGVVVLAGALFMLGEQQGIVPKSA